MTSEPNDAKSRQAVALSRRHMPTDYEISLAKYTNRGMPEEARIPKDFGPRQALVAFSALQESAEALPEARQPRLPDSPATQFE